MTGKDSSASNVVSYLAVKIMSWSTWWCQEPPLNQSPSLGWWLIATLIVGIMRMTLGCRPCSFRVQSVFSVHSWSKGVTLVHFKDHHNQQNDAPQHHLFTQHPWLQMFPSFASSLVRLQLKRTLTFSFFQHVILMFVVNLAGCIGLGGFHKFLGSWSRLHCPWDGCNRNTLNHESIPTPDRSKRGSKKCCFAICCHAKGGQQ